MFATVLLICLVRLWNQENFYKKTLWKMWPGIYFQALFSLHIILCKNQSEDVCMKIWTNSFVVLLLHISRLLQNFYFPTEVVLNSLQTSKGLKLVLRSQFLKNCLIKYSLFQCDINWTNFINRLCLLPTFFSEMYFLIFC